MSRTLLLSLGLSLGSVTMPALTAPAYAAEGGPPPIIVPGSHVTLATAPIFGDANEVQCSVVNVSQNPLTVLVTLLDLTGTPLTRDFVLSTCGDTGVGVVLSPGTGCYNFAFPTVDSPSYCSITVLGGGKDAVRGIIQAFGGEFLTLPASTAIAQ